jgi:hypothetical protein
MGKNQHLLRPQCQGLSEEAEEDVAVFHGRSPY